MGLRSAGHDIAWTGRKSALQEAGISGYIGASTHDPGEPPFGLYRLQSILAESVTIVSSARRIAPVNCAPEPSALRTSRGCTRALRCARMFDVALQRAGCMPTPPPRTNRGQFKIRDML